MAKLDLYSKLTLLAKIGLNRPVTLVSQPSDAPVTKDHAARLQAQFARATADYYMRITQIDPDLARAYMDFDAMEYMPEISSALDIYADECTTKNETGQVLRIVTENEEIKTKLETMFNDVLSIKTNLWTWIRNMCKYGNWYLFFDIQTGSGIVGYMPLPVNEIKRLEAYDGNLNSVKYKWELYNMDFDEWQIAHFRLLTDEKRYPYGTSILESSRRIWKQLQLAEDAMLVYRATRAPEKRVFYIDVGNIDPGDVDEYIQKIINKTKRSPLIPRDAGDANLKYTYNPMAIDEDFYIPRRSDKTSNIETLPGANNLGEIADVEYFQRKLFAGLKIPKAFLTYEQDVNAKATLAGQDFRFARTINRVQQAMLAELTRIAIFHLYSIGVRKIDDLLSFELVLSSPNTQLELEQLEHLKSKGEVFAGLWNPEQPSPISWTWGMRNIMGFTTDEIKEIVKQKYSESKLNSEIKNAATPDFEKTDSSGGDEFKSPNKNFGEAFSTKVDVFNSILNNMFASSEKQEHFLEKVDEFLVEDVDNLERDTKLSMERFAKKLLSYDNILIKKQELPNRSDKKKK